MRQILEQHRIAVACATCHKSFEPMGVALENFDAVGAWRTMDGKFPVDASGTLPDGRSFSGPEELATILKGDREAFGRAITKCRRRRCLLLDLHCTYHLSIHFRFANWHHSLGYVVKYRWYAVKKCQATGRVR